MALLFARFSRLRVDFCRQVRLWSHVTARRTSRLAQRYRNRDGKAEARENYCKLVPTPQLAPLSLPNLQDEERRSEGSTACVVPGLSERSSRLLRYSRISDFSSTNAKLVANTRLKFSVKRFL